MSRPLRAAAILALALLPLLSVTAPATAEAPPLDAELSITERPVILTAHTRSFFVYYRVSTPLTKEEFAARFPEAYDIGLRADCGIRTVEGVRITLDAALQWEWATVWDMDSPGTLPPPFTVSLEPEALEALVYLDPGPVVLDHMVFRDLTLATRYGGLPMTSWVFSIEASQFNGDPVAWEATITFEAYCRYFHPNTGNLVAILTTADLGGEPLTLTQSGDDVPRYGVPLATDTWSTIKSTYR